MLRVFASRLDDTAVELSDDEWHHLIKVRRALDGEEVQALDGRGSGMRCRLVRAGNDWRLEPGRRSHFPRPLTATLGVALIRRERFDWFVQKAVELGAARIVPLQTERTEPRAVSRRAERQAERWRRILIEALKQSGTGWLPELEPAVPLAGWLKHAAAETFGFLDPAGGPLRPALEALLATGEPTLLIGPEGGWSDPERAAMTAAGGRPVDLGPRILRTETAAIVSLALLQYEGGDLAGKAPAGPR